MSPFCMNSTMEKGSETCLPESWEDASVLLWSSDKLMPAKLNQPRGCCEIDFGFVHDIFKTIRKVRKHLPFFKELVETNFTQKT